MVAMDVSSDANTINTLLTQYKQTGTEESLEGVFEHMFNALDSDKTTLIIEYFYVSFISLVNSKLSDDKREMLKKVTQAAGLKKEDVQRVKEEYSAL